MHHRYQSGKEMDQKRKKGEKKSTWTPFNNTLVGSWRVHSTLPFTLLGVLIPWSPSFSFSFVLEVWMFLMTAFLIRSLPYYRLFSFSLHFLISFCCISFGFVLYIWWPLNSFIRLCISLFFFSFLSFSCRCCCVAFTHKFCIQWYAVVPDSWNREFGVENENLQY